MISAGIQLLTALVNHARRDHHCDCGCFATDYQCAIVPVAESIPQLIDAGVKLFIAITQNLPVIITTIVGAIPEKQMAAILDAIRDNRHSIVDSGKNLIEGLWEGIIAMKDWLFDKVSGFFEDVVGWAKDILGNSSPSKVFAGIGENMALKIGDGFGDEITAIGREIQRKTGDLIPSIQTNLQIEKGTQKAGVSGMMIRIGQIFDRERRWKRWSRYWTGCRTILHELSERFRAAGMKRKIYTSFDGLALLGYNWQESLSPGHTISGLITILGGYADRGGERTHHTPAQITITGTIKEADAASTWQVFQQWCALQGKKGSWCGSRQARMNNGQWRG